MACHFPFCGILVPGRDYALCVLAFCTENNKQYRQHRVLAAFGNSVADLSYPGRRVRDRLKTRFFIWTRVQSYSLNIRLQRKQQLRELQNIFKPLRNTLLQIPGSMRVARLTRREQRGERISLHGSGAAWLP